MKELLKNLPSNIKGFKKEHCITLMTLVGCLAVAMIPNNDSSSNEVLTDNTTDYEEDILQ